MRVAFVLAAGLFFFSGLSSRSLQPDQALGLLEQDAFHDLLDRTKRGQVRQSDICEPSLLFDVIALAATVVVI
jgi:hypothetical protein